MNAYFMRQFGYYRPLVWINHSRKLSNHINVLHIRAFSLFTIQRFHDTSLFKDKTVTIHHRKLQTLAYKVIKVKITCDLKHREKHS